MKSLRVQVERVVRPIRAGSVRKDRMREEMLAHLARLFDEALARTGDARFATAEAIRHFGDAPSLTRELQASVPWLERLTSFDLSNRGLTRRCPGEPPVRYMLRAVFRGFAVAAAGYALLALVLLIAYTQRPHRIDRPTSGQLVVFLMGSVAIQFAGVTLLGLSCEGIRRELALRDAAKTAVKRRRAAWRMAAIAFASSAAVWGCSFAAMMLLCEYTFHPFMTRAQFWWIILGASALGLPLTLMQARDWTVSTRRFERWESLDLDEPQP